MVGDSALVAVTDNHGDDEEECLLVRTTLLLAKVVVELCSLLGKLGGGEGSERVVEG